MPQHDVVTTVVQFQCLVLWLTVLWFTGQLVCGTGILAKSLGRSTFLSMFCWRWQCG